MSFGFNGTKFVRIKVKHQVDYQYTRSDDLTLDKLGKDSNKKKYLMRVEGNYDI